MPYKIAVADVFFNKYTADCSLMAVGGTINCLEQMYTYQICRHTFAAVRPPGHHADCSNAAGFCLFNNVAIGVRHA